MFWHKLELLLHLTIFVSQYDWIKTINFPCKMEKSRTPYNIGHSGCTHNTSTLYETTEYYNRIKMSF